MKNKGFTIIEIAMILVITGVLVAIGKFFLITSDWTIYLQVYKIISYSRTVLLITISLLLRQILTVK